MPTPVIECVPNFSEGRRPDVMEAIVNAAKETEGIKLLDWSHDADHNRMVMTFIGSPESIQRAALNSARKAVELIDLNEHRGEHPRIGAVDVIPLIPVSDITLTRCADLAHQLGQLIYQELQLPVYFYEAAATRPERKNLADIRRGNFEELKEQIQQPDRYPDVGKPRLHPTAGAVAIGARPFLVAFNVNLDSKDIKIAKTIANKIREAKGGLKNVKALGIRLENRGMIQISMNLMNCETTPIHKVMERIKKETERFGVKILSTEIVGLIPLKYLVDTASHYLQLDNFRLGQVLEVHL